MIHGLEKSASPIVASKPTNKAAREEQRGRTKGNAERLRMRRTQCRISVSQQLDRVRQAATRGEGRFTALLHHVSKDLLLLSFFWLKRKAAVGVDGVSWIECEDHLEANLADLLKRIHSNTYRVQPSRRQYIPKPDGQKQRPLGIAALGDKIAQRAIVTVLNAIYKLDFLGVSYGFRRFFDSISHDWLIRFLVHRIGDPRVINLIRKWLKAGVMEGGVLHPIEEGPPEWVVVSPLLANVFLHYVFDLWVNHWRKHQAHANFVVERPGRSGAQM